MIYEIYIYGISNEKSRLQFGIDEDKFKNMTIKQVKLKIIKEQSLALQTENIRLIFGGKQLEDSETIRSYDIINKSTLMSVTRVPGGLF